VKQTNASQEMQSMLRFLLVATLALFGPVAGATADTFPSKPIRVVIPYAPGGGTDNLVRIIAGEASAALGQQLIVDNRPGAASVIGTEAVAKATPDGYTILASDSAFLTNPGLMKHLPFDAVRDFTGVTMMATSPVILLAHPSVPAKDVKELIALAKAKPGTLNYASGGNGSSPHLAGELLKQAAGIDVVHVPYKGTGPAMTDLLGGQVQLSFTGISSSRQYIDKGQLRALALTGTKRNPAVPEVPTFAELGFGDLDANTYWGVYAPAATPKANLAILNAAFVRALRSPALADRVADLGYEPIANTPEEHTEQMRAMIQHWAEVIRRANIQAD
jgi:tripartite-type tricarboxylate transporter receptor subunit TctC